MRSLASAQPIDDDTTPVHVANAIHYPAASESHIFSLLGTPMYETPLGQQHYVSRAQPLQPSMTTSAPGAVPAAPTKDAKG